MAEQAMRGLALEGQVQHGMARPGDPDELFPKDIKINNRELSVEEHYQIARMSIGEVKRRYVVQDAEEFVARVKRAIRRWDGDGVNL